MNPCSAREAWERMVAADQTVFTIPRRRRKRSLEALRAAEARIDFVLACKTAERKATQR